MAEKTGNIATRERHGLTRHEPWGTSPFRMLEQMADEIDGIFDNFGLERNSFMPRWNRAGTRARAGAEIWMPQIEVSRQNNELVICADLPGMKKDDVSIDVTDHDITISG